MSRNMHSLHFCQTFKWKTFNKNCMKLYQNLIIIIIVNIIIIIIIIIEMILFKYILKVFVVLFVKTYTPFFYVSLLYILIMEKYIFILRKPNKKCNKKGYQVFFIWEIMSWLQKFLTRISDCFYVCLSKRSYIM